jgi:hypothetical protein
MRETRQSGSEGGVRLIPHPYPYPEIIHVSGGRFAGFEEASAFFGGGVGCGSLRLRFVHAGETKLA